MSRRVFSGILASCEAICIQMVVDGRDSGGRVVVGTWFVVDSFASYALDLLMPDVMMGRF